MLITSHNNPVIKQARKIVAESKARKQAGLFAVEGTRLCRDALQSGAALHTVFFTPPFEARFPQDAAALCEQAQRVYQVSPSVMEKLADTESPQGVLCLCETAAFGTMPSQAGRFVILENLSDPANLGAIARTAEALGVDGLLVSGGCDIRHPKALRASMGALLRLPVFEGETEQILACMRQLGVVVFAALVHGADQTAEQTDFSAPCAVVIGNEASGVTAQTAAACDRRITIPMAGRAESLNAAAAACIFMWEMTGRGGGAQ